MATIGFPVQQSFRSSWVIKPQPIVHQNGLGSLGYQGISDNSVAKMFGKRKGKGKRKASKKSKKKKRNIA